MPHRLLLASLLLTLGLNAHAAMNKVHGTSGDAGPTCPPATLVESDDAGDAKSDAIAPVAVRPSPPPAATSPAMPRPGLRWHSFLPGMMK